MLNHSAQSGRHTLAERGADLYETPACATIALTRAELLPLCVWEPAAGRGAIVNVLRGRGHRVVASDAIDYGNLDFVADFLTVTKVPAGCGCILTNPPFQIVNRFIAHALDLSPRVIVLARLALLESVARTEILEYRNLARIHIFRNRLPFMHRDSWAGPRVSSAISFAWFCWDRDYHGPDDRRSRFVGAVMVKHFTLTLRAASGRDNIKDLRALLKAAGRHFGMIATAVHETNTASPRRSAERCKLSSALRTTKMDMRKFSGSGTFVKCADVRSGPLQEKIAGVVIGKFDKPDVIFQSGAKLSVNATNNRTLVRAFGVDSEDWIDQVVELFLGEIEFQGRLQEAVLLRPISKPEHKATKAAAKSKSSGIDLGDTF